MNYDEWIMLNWASMIAAYMQRPEGNEQGWIEWTYDQYQKTTQKKDELHGVVRDQQEGPYAGIHKGFEDQAMVVSMDQGKV